MAIRTPQYYEVLVADLENIFPELLDPNEELPGADAVDRLADWYDALKFAIAQARLARVEKEQDNGN